MYIFFTPVGMYVKQTVQKKKNNPTEPGQLIVQEDVT